MARAGPNVPEASIDVGARPDETGLLDRDDWSRSSPLHPLVRAEDGTPPREETLVRVAGSRSGLHVRFDCMDRDIHCAHVLRDAPLWEEEAVEVFVAEGSGSPTRYLEIEVNPAGALYDAVVMNPDGRRETMQVDPRWDGEGVVARVGRDAPGGWWAEIILPWLALWGRLDPPRVLRANFFRIERPRDCTAEFTTWSPTFEDPPDFHKPARFGRIVVAPEPRLQAEIVPDR